MIGVFWKREWSPIKWHQCHLLTRQLLYSVFTSIVYAQVLSVSTRNNDAWWEISCWAKKFKKKETNPPRGTLTPLCRALAGGHVRDRRQSAAWWANGELNEPAVGVRRGVLVSVFEVQVCPQIVLYVRCNYILTLASRDERKTFNKFGAFFV